MRVIFLSERECALTVNGLYLGTVDGFERSVELDPADGVFCECKPAHFHAVRFRFDEDFLFSPPPEADLIFTRDGVAVALSRFVREDASLRVVAQEKIGGVLCTLTVQGKVQLSFENETGFHLVGLGDAFERASLFAAGGDILVEGEESFCIVGREGKILLESEGRVTARGARVCAEVPLHDSRGHVAACAWEGGKLTECTLRGAGAPDRDTFALALFESVLIGADPLPFLSPALSEKAGALKDYLGDFRFVCVTPDPAVVGLVYRMRERVYGTRYFRVTVEGDKISNIAPLGED